MKIRRKLIIFLEGFIAVNILWYVAALIANVNILPSPAEVYRNMANLNDQGIYLHILASFYRIISGIGISLILGISAGLIMAYSAKWNKLLGPIVYFTYPVPKTVLLPVLMLLFGLGDSSKIMLIVLIVVFQVIIASRDAVLNIPDETYHTLQSLGATKFQIFRNITLPAIMPELLTNLRISAGTALSILFFAEAYGTHYGIGYYILDAWTRIDYISMYTGIVIISLVGFLLFISIDILEETVCKWKQTAQQGGF